MRTRLLAAALFSLSFTFQADASTVTGGALLSQEDADQIESWMNGTGLSFTNIYEADVADHSVAAFHTAADGQGPTISLLLITYDVGAGPVQALIGGYNPSSWFSNPPSYNSTPSDEDRTAFIFNLTTNVLQRQNLTGEGQADSGSYQAYNGADRGPAFGAGHDLVLFDPFGYLYNFSYGGTSYGSNLLGQVGQTDFQLNRLEVFTVSASEVPEPSTFAIMGLTLIGLGVTRVKRVRR